VDMYLTVMMDFRVRYMNSPDTLNLHVLSHAIVDSPGQNGSQDLP
jgi:hypothetical protein